MSGLNRRDFLLAAGLAGAAWPARAQEPAAGPGPELAVINGAVYTVDGKRPRAEAFAVHHGRFIAVGTTREIRQLITPATQVLDAAGQTVVPGFIDAHSHPASSGLSELLEVDCNRKTIAAIQQAIKERAEKTPAGEWVLGFKYDDTKLEDGRPLNRADLDAVAPRHPVRVEHRGGHTAICNSLAFREAKIDRNTPDPEGGQFGRDARGDLTGFVAEKASQLMEQAAKGPPITPKVRQAGVKKLTELMAAAGLTSVHDAMTSPESWVAYQDALAADELPVRVYIMAVPELYRTFQAAGLRTGFGDERLRIGGVKLFCDGSASERTMRMSTPYVGRPNDFGILVTTQEKLNEQVAAAHAARFQVGVHANGDVAIDMVLKAYDLALRMHPRPNPRHRIEHCTLVNPGLLQRIAEQGVIPTPFYTYVYYHGDKWAQYGDDKVRWMFAHRSFLDHGIPVAGASDYVPGPYEPLTAIQSMVTRTDYRGRAWGDNQKVTVDEALKICTLNGAHASFEEKIKGSITTGKLADFVILGDDPHTVEPGKIKDIPVRRTVVGGRTVHLRS